MQSLDSILPQDTKKGSSGCHFLLLRNVVYTGAMQIVCEEYGAGHGRGPLQIILLIIMWRAANGG